MGLAADWGGVGPRRELEQVSPMAHVPESCRWYDCGFPVIRGAAKGLLVLITLSLVWRRSQYLQPALFLVVGYVVLVLK